MNSIHNRILFAACICLTLKASAQPQPLYPRIAFPADAGVITVTEHGIRNDGSTDVTQALQRLFDQHGSYVTYYFPNGSYLLSDTVSLKQNTRVNLIGESRDGVIFQLADNAPGFSNPNAPKKILQSAQRRAQSFWINWLNFTVDVGRGNPGAIGMEYGANNQGTLRDVVIRDRFGAGAVGLDMTGPAYGPLLVENVIIQGFDIGLVSERSVRVIEHLWLRGQRKLGILNRDCALFVRGLNFEGSVPAYRAETRPGSEAPGSLLLLTHSTLRGTNGSAIEGGELHLRQTLIEGFSSTAVRTEGRLTPPPTGPVIEWNSRGPTSLFGADTAVRLEPRDPPVVPWSTDFSRWANVLDFVRPEDGNDQAPAVQRAMNSGAEVIYFPNLRFVDHPLKGTHYTLASRMSVPPSVRRIVAPGANLHHKNLGRAGNHLWHITGQTDQPLIFEFIMSLYGLENCMRIAHLSPRPLVIRSSTEIILESRHDAGDLHARDVTGLGWRLRNPNAWLAQFNLEAALQDGLRPVKLETYGTRAWCMGFKSEMEGDILHAEGGAVEILGSMFYGGPGNSPLFSVKNADLTVIHYYEIIGSILPRGYFTMVEEEKNGTRRAIHRGMDPVIPRDSRASLLPFYLTRKDAAAGTPRPWIQGGQDEIFQVGTPVSLPIPHQAAPGAVFSAADLPPGLSIHPQNGTLTGSPSRDGRWFSTLTVRNPDGTEASAALRLNVGTPVITPPADLRLKANTPASIPLTIQFADRDNRGRANVRVRGLPDGLRFHSDSLEITGSAKIPATYLVRIIARNKVGGAIADFTLTVQP